MPLIDDRPVKIVPIVDEHTHACLGHRPHLWLPGRVALHSTAPDSGLRGDGRLGRRTRWPALHSTRAGWCNGEVESFNAWIPYECLNVNIFWFLARRA